MASGEVIAQTLNGRPWYVWNGFSHHVTRAKEEKQELSSQKAKLKKDELELLLVRKSKIHS